MKGLTNSTSLHDSHHEKKGVESRKRHAFQSPFSSNGLVCVESVPYRIFPEGRACFSLVWQAPSLPRSPRKTCRRSRPTTAVRGTNGKCDTAASRRASASPPPSFDPRLLQRIRQARLRRWAPVSANRERRREPSGLGRIATTIFLPTTNKDRPGRLLQRLPLALLCATPLPLRRILNRRGREELTTKPLALIAGTDEMDIMRKKVRSFVAERVCLRRSLLPL